MSADHDRWRELLALEALDCIDPDERAELVDHLAGCEHCRGEQRQLADIAAALADAARDEDEAPGPTLPPASLERRVLDRARDADRAQRRRRFAWRGAAVAAAAVVATLALIALRPDGPGAPPTEAITFSLVREGADADASLIAHTWGVEVDLVVTGLPVGTRYTAQFIGQGGGTVPAGTFIGTSGKPIVCHMNAALLRADAREFVVTDAAGQVVLSAALPAS